MESYRWLGLRSFSGHANVLFDRGKLGVVFSGVETNPDHRICDARGDFPDCFGKTLWRKAGNRCPSLHCDLGGQLGFDSIDPHVWLATV